VAFQPNPGEFPTECEIWADVETDGILARSLVGYRAVHVRLWGGYDSKAAGDRPWPSKGGRPFDTRWAISRKPHPFEIREYEVV